MSNLSAKYDPTEASPHKSTLTVDDPTSATMYVGAGMLPQNLLSLAGKSESFRDAFIGTLASQSISDDSVLNVLTTTLRTTPNETTVEFRALCEITASLAYAWGKTEVTKEVLLRVPPAFASRYLQSVYSALMQHKVPAEKFQNILLDALPTASVNWSMEKARMTP